MDKNTGAREYVFKNVWPRPRKKAAIITMRFFLLIVLVSVASLHAFTQKPCLSSRQRVALSLATPDASNAQALSDYMAKSHVEKLRAVKQVEDQKNAEIQALKQEVERLRQSSSSSSSAMTAPLTTTKPIEGSMEELQAKLMSYQQFMTKYIVKAQEEKIAAIKAAEAATAKKFEERLQNLLPQQQQVPTLEASKDTKLYMKRNMKVTEAAKVGKSRWGDMETKRAAEQVGMNIVNGATSEVVVNVPPEVKQADHGLRADGGVGGPCLAQRVAFGANGASSAVSEQVAPTPVTATAPIAQNAPITHASPVISHKQILYNERNKMVSAAAKAGKSRWGPLEVEKATQLASLPMTPAASTAAIPVSPEIVAADHGLRSAGSVGGPSLAERVNIGAQIDLYGDAMMTSPTNGGSSLYQRRNVHVTAAAQAGKSRWGIKEVEKATMLSKNILPTAGAGMRSEEQGGAGGTSLFQRVNLGAQLLKK